TCLTMSGTARAAASVLTVTRTSSLPAAWSAITCATVAGTSAVSVLVIDCTTIGWPLPTFTPSTSTTTVFLRSGMLMPVTIAFAALAARARGCRRRGHRCGPPRLVRPSRPVGESSVRPSPVPCSQRRTPMNHTSHLRPSFIAVLLSIAILAASAWPARADMLIVGNDQKVVWGAEGNRQFVAPGKDTISVVDITDREAPKILVSFPLMNSIFGPPVNLAITPDERLAIVANSVTWVQDGTAWKPAPDNKLYVIDLKANPPSHIATVEVGKQPSGLAINRAGNLALIANRNDKSISVLSIQGTDVKLVDTVAMGDEVASVAITPDGKRALVTKFPAHKIAVLEISGQKVTDTKKDMPVGLWPYNIDITPDGKIGISADNGNSGSPDGHIDTVSGI